MSKTVIVYNFEQTCSAMKAAKKLKKKIYISSPDNAGSYMGPLFFKQLVFNASKLFPKVDYSEILNCSNDIGIALEAIECGIKNICKKKGVGINTINNKKLDLKNVKNTYDECLKWFKI